MKSKSKMFPVAITLVVGLIIGIFVGFSLLNFYYVGPHEVHTTEFKPVSYTDFVTILLAVITVLLAIMGIFFAVLAVFSYSTITSKAVDQSVEASSKIIDSAFKPDGEIHNLILGRMKSDKEFRESIIESVSREFIVSISNDQENSLDDDINTEENLDD